MHITRKQSIRIAFGAIAVFFLGSAYAIRSNSMNQRAAPVATPASTDSISQDPSLEGQSKFVLNNFERSESKAGKKLWQIRAERGELFPQQNIAKIENALLLLFREDGSTVELTAPHGTLHLEANSVSKADLYGGIRIVYGTEYTVTTEQATFDRIHGKISSPTFTTIKGQTLNAAGDSLAVDTNTKDMQLQGNVSTEILGNTTDKPQPEAASALLHAKGKIQP